MSVKMRHQTNSPKATAIFTGPRADDQKPVTCSKCGQPVGRAYRVYSRNPKTGAVVRGQYEVAHIKDGAYVFDSCPYPSLLEQLQAKVEADRGQEDESNPDRRVIHKETKTEKGGVRVACGAKGGLWTSEVDEDVTCWTCKDRITKSKVSLPNTSDQDEWNRMQQKEDEIEEQEQEDEIDQTIKENLRKEEEMSKKPAVSREDIARKIAEAKQKKQTAATAGGGIVGAGTAKTGTSAALVGVDDDEAPMPKATVTGKSIKRQNVQSGTSKKEKEASSGVMNLCGCGCQQPCKSNFLPGHDAKLHGWMRKLEQGAIDITTIPGQVKDGMYGGVKQTKVKDGEWNGVKPSTDEKTYLGMLKGKGGKVNG